MDEKGTYEGIDYRVIRRAVKYARIDMRSGEVLLIMPEGMKTDDLFRKNGGRIVKRFRELERIRKEAGSDVRPGEITLIGRRFAVKQGCGDEGNGAVLDRKERIITVCPSREEGIKHVLREYLRENIERIVAKYSEKAGLKPGRIYIREQITKWGSCSSRTNLSFNLRLVFLPRSFLDYIVAHEVMHLRHMNHGEQFKRELSEMYGGKIPDRETMMKYWFRAELMMESLVRPTELREIIEDLKSDPALAGTIESRLSGFRQLGRDTTEKWFSELCFCILTANTSADMGMRIQQAISPEEFMTMSEEEIIERLHSLHARFYRMRGHYIQESQRIAPVLKETIVELAGPPGKSTYDSEKDARKWLVENVKGFGYKEASHFLRNVGYENLAILDKHILRIMKNHGMIDEIRPLTPKRYLEIEEKLRAFGEEVGMGMAELDLYLWYMATGTVKK